MTEMTIFGLIRIPEGTNHLHLLEMAETHKAVTAGPNVKDVILAINDNPDYFPIVPDEEHEDGFPLDAVIVFPGFTNPAEIVSAISRCGSGAHPHVPCEILTNPTPNRSVFLFSSIFDTV